MRTSGVASARSRVALATACSVLLSSVAVPTAQAPAAAKAPAPTVKVAPTDVDGGWPRAYSTTSGAVIILYQPQVASWTDQKHAVMDLAISYTPKGATKPAMGTIRLEADTSVAVDQRLVSFDEFKITKSNFSTLTPDEAKKAVDEITTQVPKDERVIALDRVLAYVDKSQIVPKNVEGLKADPPVIFFSTTPAIIVNVDGDPVWSPIKDNELQFAVNTNWDLFQHPATKTLYLRDGRSWYQAPALAGPWKAASKLPDSFSKLPPDDNWKDVKSALPPTPVTHMPTVFVSTQPAELILLTGAPVYLAVTGTQLLWVSNTDSDVFRLGKGGPVYFLVAGRWFSAPDFKGPWTFATPTLPEDFKKIPLAHQRSRVLASVPGTQQAAEAVLLAQVPQTAHVDKKAVKAPDVAFQGDPQFQPIEKTAVQRAVNTDKDIIRVGDKFYMCYDGVWFVASAPGGPWEVTGQVPKEIYEIPPSSPTYNVTYVTVEKDSSDSVDYATMAAFGGMMVAWGCVVWGTGYYYPPYIGYGGFYPGYFPYYPTYGYGASYNPWTGTYGRGAAVYGPYGGAGVGAKYNPRTGTYARGASAWGPYGSRSVAGAYNPRTGARGATRQGSNVYGSWGQSAVRRGDQWATTSRVTNNRTGATTRVTQGSGGSTAVTRNGPGVGNNSGVVRTGSGDMYAGRDGNVYRNTGDGWQQVDGSNRPSDRPTPQQQGDLNKDRAARADGAQRTRDAGAVNRGAPAANPGSYRPSGGGMRSMPRGGGGRRR